MKKLLIKTFSAVLLTAAVSACSSSSSDTEKSEIMTFSCLTGSKSYYLDDTAQEFNRDADLVYRDSAVIVMPESLYSLDITNLREAIMKMAFDTVCSTPRQAMDAFFEDAVDRLGYSFTEVPDSLASEEADGFTTVTGDVYNFTSRRLTYRIADYTYLPGAAHGMHTCLFLTFDMENGDIITLDELFTAEGLERLPEIIATRARKLQSLIGPTEIEALPSDGNFFISLDDEIVFVYQPYEVASYAQGLIMVPFHPYQLADLLTPRALSFFNLDREP